MTTTTAPQTTFPFLATVPVVPPVDWQPIAVARAKLCVSTADLERAIGRGLEVRWVGGHLLPNGQRAPRRRLVELNALRAACGLEDHR